ncbi:hypothetical protein ACFL1X_12465 [Candidatus Hydrogenedentota bacterium]
MEKDEIIRNTIKVLESLTLNDLRDEDIAKEIVILRTIVTDVFGIIKLK